jgi:regulator of nucleoside diphosphate kinase
MTLMTTNVSSQDRLMMTAADFDRLSHLLESPQYRASHAALLAALKQELERSEVVPPAGVPRGVVTMHSQVRMRDLKTRETETYTLVYPDEANIDDGKLSVLAPLGVALLGTRAGQVVEVAAPAGLRRIKVERVLYQPEAAGDYHL